MLPFSVWCLRWFIDYCGVLLVGLRFEGCFCRVVDLVGLTLGLWLRATACLVLVCMAAWVLAC